MQVKKEPTDVATDEPMTSAAAQADAPASDEVPPATEEKLDSAVPEDVSLNTPVSNQAEEDEEMTKAEEADGVEAKKEEEEARAKQQSKMTDFNEDEIKMLCKQFKMEFPSGNVNKPQAKEVIRKVFPRYDADCLLKNIFEIFDNPIAGNGRVSNNEILWVFSMAMSGTGKKS